VPLKARLKELGALITKQQNLAPEKVRQWPTPGYKASQLSHQN
jgi:hypothetical protein